MDYFHNADQDKIFTRCWKPSCEPVAVLFIAHGVGEHSGRYESLATLLNEHKYAVYSHDYVGHGNSSGERVHITTFQTYVRDIVQHIEMLKQSHTDIPFFLLGHSMGGTVATLVAIQEPELFSGIVFSAPGLLYPVGPIKRGLTRIISYFAPQLQLTGSQVDTISRDPDEVRDYLEDPLVWHGGLKAAWATAVLDAQYQIANDISRIRLPFITIHGTDDRMVDIASSQFLFDNAQSKDKTFEQFKGGQHKLLADLERDRFKQVILDWLNKHIMTS